MQVRQGCFGSALCVGGVGPTDGGGAIAAGDFYQQGVHLAPPRFDAPPTYLYRCALSICQTRGASSSTCQGRGGLRRPECSWSRVQDGADALETLHPVPRRGYPSHSMVEVMHAGFDPPYFGYWLYMTAGSGIYLNLSRTRAFDDHAAAARHFCPNGTGPLLARPHRGRAARGLALLWRSDACQLQNEQGMVAAATAAGYDTLQFTRFVEYGLVKHEVVLLGVSEDERATSRRRVRGNACPPAARVELFRSGWGGSRPCRCRVRRRCWQAACVLNCDVSP